MGKAKIKNMQGGDAVSSSAAVNSEMGRGEKYLFFTRSDPIPSSPISEDSGSLLRCSEPGWHSVHIITFKGKRLISGLCCSVWGDKSPVPAQPRAKIRSCWSWSEKQAVQRLPLHCLGDVTQTLPASHGTASHWHDL